MATSRVLLTSSSFDEHTHGPVQAEIERRGHEVVTYLTDRVMAGQDRFELSLGGGRRDPEMTYNGRSISPSDLNSAWYWKVANFALPDAEVNLSKQLTMVNEMTQVNNSIWSLYPDHIWLSSPRAIQLAERKLPQLMVAQSLGFEVPATKMSSDWDPILEKLGSQDFVAKMFRGVIADQNTIKAMYTTKMTPQTLARLRGVANPFPGIYQNYVEKYREWRVTVVGDDVFAGAIYTDDTARDDWRRLQNTAAVAMRADKLDDDVADMCRSYLKAFGLGLGSFDLVERPDGSVVFLECNPNGQFGFLAEVLELPIFSAVADEILRRSA